MKAFAFFLFFYLSGSLSPVKGQTFLADSLRKRVSQSTSDEGKLGALLDMFEEYHSINRDTLDKYGPVIKELAASSKNNRMKSLAALAYANWYYRWGWSDSSLVFIEPEISRNPVGNPETRDIYFKLMRAKALFLGSKSRYAEALNVLYALLPAAEKYKDTLTIGLTTNTIGSIAIARQQPYEALKWINQAIQIAGNNKRYLQVQTPAFINAAYAYVNIGNNDSAVYFINKGLKYSRQLQNLNYLATVLRIQTNIYTAKKQYKLAEEAMIEMINTRAKLTSANYILEDNLQLADFYANSGQLEKAIEICKNNLRKGELTSEDTRPETVFTNDPKQRAVFLAKLAGYYKQAGLMKEYQASLEELVDAKDSLYAANSAEAIAELQTKYEVQKKENTILQQKYSLQQKNLLFYGLMALTSILIICGFALFRNYRRKQKMRVKKLMDEERKQAEEAIKNAEERERVRIASDLHDNLGAYAASMASNISYIQLPDADDKTKNAFEQLSANSQSIISQLNDTIWVLKKETLHFTAISDRIKTFVNRLRKSYPEISLEVQEDVATDFALPSSQAFHLYRITQEAINNALRHSNGRNIVTRFSAHSNWEVTVADDGTGFRVNEYSGAAGNGLLNMSQRSREAGWQISWQTPEQGGTIVKIAPTTN